MASTSDEIVMYSTSWCSDCYRAKHFFNEYGINYQEIDIERHPDAVETVMQLNGGYRSVPTIVFPDGDVLVEPSYRQLADKTGIQL